MDNDSNILHMPKSPESPTNDASKDEMNTLFRQLEERLEHSLSRMEGRERRDRDLIREEIQNIVGSFEKRLNERLEELGTSGDSSRITGALSSSVGQLNRILRRMMSLPDFDFIKRSEEVDEFGLDPEFENQVMPFFKFLHNRYWRVETYGVNHVPNQGRALIVSNHSGVVAADGAMIKVAVRQSHPTHRAVRFLVEDFVYHFPYLGMFMTRFGGVRACQENAERLLQNEQVVTVFPEGIKGVGKLYRHRYRLQRFGRGGVIRLAIKTRTPIIPTAVIGAEEIYPMIARSNFLARPLGLPFIPVTPTFPLLGPLGLLPLPSKWSIHFGAPISYEQYGPDAYEDRLLVSRLNEELRESIQEMIKDQLTKRVSVWIG